MDTRQRALGALTLATNRLLSRYPLLGGIVSRWKLHADREIKTMGVGLSRTGGFDLFYSSEFVVSIKLDELVGVLHHEVRHLLFGHPFLDPERFPDKRALVIAQEVTVNENLPEPLPGNPVVLSGFPQLAPDEDTLTRYRKLAGKVVPPKSAMGSRQGASPPSTTAPDSPGDASDHSGLTIDDHSRWQSIRDQESAAKAILAQDIRIASRNAPGLTVCEHELIEKISNQQGNGAGHWLSVIEISSAARTVNWQKHLRSFVGRELSSEISYQMPSRRLPQLWGIVPGRARRSVRPNVVCAIDTSASMTDDILSDVVQELTYLAREAAITIVECDEKIQRTYKYRGRIETVLGRGGTSFIPVLQDALLKKMKADVLLIFTDGFGPATKFPPQIPVAWVLTPGGESPVKWEE